MEIEFLETNLNYLDLKTDGLIKLNHQIIFSTLSA